MHTHVSVITWKLLKQIYEKACPVNDLACFFLCQDYHGWAASRGEGHSGAFVTHCNISCSISVFIYLFYYSFAFLGLAAKFTRSLV